MEANHIAQSVASQIADPGAMSKHAGSHTFVEINREIFSPPSPDSRRVVVSYRGKYVQEVQVNRLVKIAQEKV